MEDERFEHDLYQRRLGNSTTQAYDACQALMLKGDLDMDAIEMKLIKDFPDVAAKGLVPTVIRKAGRDLYA